ncbi:MAG: sigma-70 family RNA polymerase sigma factor [Vicinamibacteria bacterium]
MRRPWGQVMYDPTSALPVEEFLGVEREVPEARRLSLDESALIDRCLAGDDTAFDQIVQRYQDMVFNLSCRLLGRHEEAVDLSQEVFLQVYRKLSSFRRDAALRTWIYRIVINRAKNRQRWWKRRLGEMTALPIEEAESSLGFRYWANRNSSNGDGDRIAPDEALERKEQGQILRREIESLPFDQRTILLLKEIEGLSYEEISTTLGLPLGTVKSRLARARKSLRENLDPGLFGISEEV